MKIENNQLNVNLVQGKGSKGRGGGTGGYYWHIYLEQTRVGFIFINWIDEKPIGEHASIQIKINAKFRNKGIGRIAYRLACENSHYDRVYAHMRKSNVSSRKAAHSAGFKIVEDKRISQLVMLWERS